MNSSKFNYLKTKIYTAHNERLKYSRENQISLQQSRVILEWLRATGVDNIIYCIMY